MGQVPEHPPSPPDAHRVIYDALWKMGDGISWDDAGVLTGALSRAGLLRVPADVRAGELQELQAQLDAARSARDGRLWLDGEWWRVESYSTLNGTTAAEIVRTEGP